MKATEIRNVRNTQKLTYLQPQKNHVRRTTHCSQHIVQTQGRFYTQGCLCITAAATYTTRVNSTNISAASSTNITAAATSTTTDATSNTNITAAAAGLRSQGAMVQCTSYLIQHIYIDYSTL